MRWLADENISRAAIDFLRKQDQDILAVSDHQPGLPDEQVLALARDEQRGLLTFDRDFGNLIFERGLAPASAVVFLRFYPQTPRELETVLLEVAGLGESGLAGYFTVVTKDGLRQRPFP